MCDNYRARSFVLIVLGAMGVLSIGACTSRSIYEANQRDAHNACLNKPSGIERDKCLDRTSQSYDEYTREREKVQQSEQGQLPISHPTRRSFTPATFSSSMADA